MIRSGILIAVAAALLGATSHSACCDDRSKRVMIRGIYGGVPTELLEEGSLKEHGVNAIFLGSSAITDERFSLLKQQGVKVFAEFNTMHVARFVEEHPDAAPIGVDGKVSPPPQGWQGICPTHEGYRRFRMDAFGDLLDRFLLDGVWLDYHHSHASWERAEPEMPDTCFCDRCVDQFQRESKITLSRAGDELPARVILREHHDAWVRWRCNVFTDWVREFRSIIDSKRPQALLGTFHCPWTDEEYDGALRNKLAIDLKAQGEYIDVFSVMPYHARFGHAGDPEWISRQTEWLGNFLGIEGKANERHQIWPIVQLSDWGEPVPASEVRAVLEHGTRAPATGVMVFRWGSLRTERAKIEAMTEFYRSIR